MKRLTLPGALVPRATYNLDAEDDDASTTRVAKIYNHDELAAQDPNGRWGQRVEVTWVWSWLSWALGIGITVEPQVDYVHADGSPCEARMVTDGHLDVHLELGPLSIGALVHLPRVGTW